MAMHTHMRTQRAKFIVSRVTYTTENKKIMIIYLFTAPLAVCNGSHSHMAEVKIIKV